MAQVIWHFKIQCNIEDNEEKLRKVYLKVLYGKKFIFLLDGVTQPIRSIKTASHKTLPDDCCIPGKNQPFWILPKINEAIGSTVRSKVAHGPRSENQGKGKRNC